MGNATFEISRRKIAKNRVFGGGYRSWLVGRRKFLHCWNCPPFLILIKYCLDSSDINYRICWSITSFTFFGCSAKNGELFRELFGLKNNLHKWLFLVFWSININLLIITLIDFFWDMIVIFYRRGYFRWSDDHYNLTRFNN